MRRRISAGIVRYAPNPSQLPPVFALVPYVRRKLNPFATLIFGILFGSIFTHWLAAGGAEAEKWRGTAPETWTHSPGAAPRELSLPTMAQRRRVLDIMGTLTGKHTRTCLRTAQKPYRLQVYERYSPIVGFQDRKQGFFGRIRHAVKDARKMFEEETEVSRIFATASRDPRKFRGGKGLRPSYEGHKFYFAINLYMSFEIIPDLFSNMFKVSAIVGFHNVFISVYENGSFDQTKSLLRLFDGICRAIGLRVVIRTDLRVRSSFAHRIEYLAEVRNAALVPLHELRETEGEVFDSIIFMNDVLPCVDDLLELIWQSRVQNAGITCGSDYIFHAELNHPIFYDNWVARDLNGTALQNAPFEGVFQDPPSADRFMKHLPIQVQSCWNGIAILDPAPFYMIPHTVFRMADLPAGECSASECSLICNDYWNVGYGRIIMIARVKLAYSPHVFRMIHPARRNLTESRAYTRLGGGPEGMLADPQDRIWHGPHDRLFRPEESEVMVFKQPPPFVWCWGWDGAGDLEGPDVEPIWEPVPKTKFDPVKIRHDRSF